MWMAEVSRSGTRGWITKKKMIPQPKMLRMQANLMRGSRACVWKIKHKLSYALIIKNSRHALMKHSSAPAKPEQTLTSIRNEIDAITKELAIISQNKCVLPNRETLSVVKLLPKFDCFVLLFCVPDTWRQLVTQGHLISRNRRVFYQKIAWSLWCD